MTAILVHLGCEGPYISNTTPPAHLEHCIDQYKLFNTDDLYIVTDSCNIPLIPRRDRVFAVAAEDYRSDKVDELVRLWPYSEKDFWTVSLTRFVYIEEFMRCEGLRDIFHFENDVLVYTDLSCIADICRDLSYQMAITPGGQWICMTGMMYIRYASDIASMTNFFIDTLSKHGRDGVVHRYGLYALEEMQMLWVYLQEHWHLKEFPILPYGAHSLNYGFFNSVFDPATYGQYVGGTRTDGPGVKVPNHYIGQELLAHPDYDVVWVNENGWSVPYFKWTDGSVKINNLHIHSKNLHLYRSDNG